MRHRELSPAALARSNGRVGRPLLPDAAMNVRFQFSLKSLLILISVVAFGFACFSGGMAVERSHRGVKGEALLKLLQERDSDDSDWAPLWNKRVNDVFHGKELLRCNGEPFTFAIDVA